MKKLKRFKICFPMLFIFQACFFIYLVDPWYKSTLLFFHEKHQMLINSYFKICFNLFKSSTFHSSLTYLFTIDFLMYFMLKWYFNLITIKDFRIPLKYNKNNYKVLTYLHDYTHLITFNYRNNLRSLTTTNKIQVCW